MRVLALLFSFAMLICVAIYGIIVFDRYRSPYRQLAEIHSTTRDPQKIVSSRFPAGSSVRHAVDRLQSLGFYCEKGSYMRNGLRIEQVTCECSNRFSVADINLWIWSHKHKVWIDYGPEDTITEVQAVEWPYWFDSAGPRYCNGEWRGSQKSPAGNQTSR